MIPKRYFRFGIVFVPDTWRSRNFPPQMTKLISEERSLIQIEGILGKTELALRQPISPITSGSKNSIFLHFSFSRFWREYTERYADFFVRGGKHYRTRISGDGVCTVPERALARSGKILVSVYGIRHGKGGREDARIVSELAPIFVTRGGYSEASEEV